MYGSGQTDTCDEGVLGRQTLRLLAPVDWQVWTAAHKPFSFRSCQLFVVMCTVSKAQFLINCSLPNSLFSRSGTVSPRTECLISLCSSGTQPRLLWGSVCVCPKLFYLRSPPDFAKTETHQVTCLPFFLWLALANNKKYKVTLELNIVVNLHQAVIPSPSSSYFSCLFQALESLGHGEIKGVNVTVKNLAHQQCLVGSNSSTTLCYFLSWISMECSPFLDCVQKWHLAFRKVPILTSPVMQEKGVSPWKCVETFCNSCNLTLCGYSLAL